MEPQHVNVDREESPRKKANLLSKFCFWYTRPIFEKGREGQLSISDVYRCLASHRATPQGDAMGKTWKKEVQNQSEHKQPSLVRTILSVYGFKFFTVNIIFSIFDTAVRLSIPLCLEGLITYFSPAHGGISETHAYLYAAGIVGLMMLQASMLQPMILWILELGMKIRVACCSLLYRKLLRIDQNAEGKASEGLTGYIINLLTTDAERFDMAALFILDLIRGPIESLIIVYIMYRQIGAASLIGVILIVLFIPLQAYISKVSSRLRDKTTERTDNRIRMMNEVIQSIEAIKMYAWEKPFAKMVGFARRKEMNIIKKMAWLHAVMLACGKLTTKVAVLVSVVSYISIYGQLSAAKVYVMFSYYDILKMNLADFLPFAITSMLEAHVSVKRMQYFLLLREVENRHGLDLTTIDEKSTSGKGDAEKSGNGHHANNKMIPGQDSKPPVLISVQNYTAHWSKTDDDDDDTTEKKVIALNDINLTIKPDTLTVIIGTVGAGKSTLLQAILGELSPTSGKIETYGKIAYAPQDPWLFESSIRQNILFGEELDLRRYKKVVQCCQLLPDLDILPNGDQTVVGERGVALSGGQRARISLARCVYQMADVYVLDDPLAAVDAKVAQAIYLECIKGFLQSKAVVLVTHHVQYATNADHVVIMRNSQITAQGTYEEMKKSDELEKTVKESETKDEETEAQKNAGFKRQESVERHYKVRSRSTSEASQLSFSMDMDKEMDPDFEDEHQNKGSVSRGVYLAYVRSGGTKWTMLLLVVLFVSAQMFYSATDVWLIIISAERRPLLDIGLLYYEHQNTGSVSRGVYLAYVRSGGTKWTMLLLAVLFVSAQMFYSATDIWLQQWVNIEEEYSAELQKHTNTSPAGNTTASTNTTTAANTTTEANSTTAANSSVSYVELSQNRFGLTREQCIYVYGALVAICVVFLWNKLVTFYNTCIKASIALHDSMFRGVTNAPMWFFHHNPSGRILNRFSHDMGQTDTLMPGALVECGQFVLEVIFILIVVCLVNWWLILPTAVLVVILIVLRSLYVSTSRELERIEAITNSQTLSHATATVSGLTTIRSCSAQQRTLALEFDKLQDLHSSAWAMVLTTSRAFEWWMNLLSCAFLTCVIGSFFILDQQIASGSVGLAITQVLGLIGMCQFGIRQTAELENHMTSVERILEYRDLPAESPVEPDEHALRNKHPRLDINSWPAKGEIVFEDVSLEYEKPPKQDPPKEESTKEATKESPAKEEASKEPTLAINGVSFTIKPSEKVAVVGRTGAGKSSLISALFRLNRISGSIRVDGVSAEEVGLRTWRSHLCALPQRPALFAASLRDNLDPGQEYSDAQILRALDQVELRDMVANLPAGLNSKVGDGGGNFSSGQRQLLCMARAALAGCRVLVLDEATANVDAATDKHIQETIRTKFAESTVLTIAHRLNTVMDYDRVIVMDKGRVVETGHPYELLTRSNTSAYESPKKNTLSPNSQAPLATPEDFYFESSQKLNDEFYKLTRRTRTITDNSQSGQVAGIFKTLVEQTGKETAAMLYKMAEESYNKRVTKKDL